MMKIFLVGGAVRDTLMGVTPSDNDYVVVGATEATMIDLGFKQVGASFPVFLHPETGEEYALARTERKVGAGYLGFETETNDVSIEDDLSRRDFTINSIAMDVDTKEIIDPFNGEHDIDNRILRHTSDAFTEDPVRILRAFRFAIRFGFKIHPETSALIKKTVGSLNEVPFSRIIQEFTKVYVKDGFRGMYEFAQLCIRYRLNIHVKAIAGLCLPGRRWYDSGMTYVDPTMLMGVFFDSDLLPEDTPRDMRMASIFYTTLKTFDVICEAPEDVLKLIQRFRLTGKHVTSQFLFFSKLLNHDDFEMIRSCIREIDALEITEDMGVSELQQMKMDAVTRIMNA